MREDKCYIGAARHRAIERKAGDGARGVGWKFDDRGVKSGEDIAAARHRRMDEHLGFTPAKLVEYSCESVVAEQLAVVAAQQSDAVEIERVERVLDLLETAFGVRQRYRRKHAETAGIILDHLRAELVADPGAHAGRFAAVVEPHAGSCHGHDSRGDAGLVHLVEGELRSPA